MKTFTLYCNEKYDEAFLDSMTKSFKANYNQAQQGVGQNYDKYADVAKQALAKAGGTAKMLSQKTGVPLPLATALVAAGITGGPTAIPFAALLYFIKQPLMKGANKAFDATWDTGAKAVQGVKNAVSRNQTQPQAQLQPESFRAFIEASWGDWAGQKLGGAAGTVAGNLAGYGGKIAGSIGGRIKEIGQYAKNNPKEVARMAFLVGAGAAIGAGVGKLTHDVQDLIVQKIKDYGVPQEELNWLRQNVVLDTKVDKHGQAHTSSNEDLLGKPEDFASGKIYASPNPDEDTYINSQQVSTSSNSKSLFDKTIANKQDVDSEYEFIGSESPSTGKSAVFSANIEAPSSGLSHSDMGDAYRTMARTMHNNDHGGDMMKHLKGLSADPSINAAAEIKRRLASPDTYTNPAAIAGGVVGGTGNRRRT